MSQSKGAPTKFWDRNITNMSVCVHVCHERACSCVSWKAKGKHELGWEHCQPFQIAGVTPHRKEVEERRQRGVPGMEQGNGEWLVPGTESSEQYKLTEDVTSCRAQLHRGEHNDNSCMVWPQRLAGPPELQCSQQGLEEGKNSWTKGCGQRLSEGPSSRWMGGAAGVRWMRRDGAADKPFV